MRNQKSSDKMKNLSISIQ